MSDAPTPKYRLTLEITGNSHEEIQQELRLQVNGGYLMNTDYYKRDQHRVIGGRVTSTLEHLNPDMTPERYDSELMAWFRP